jgi:hypothetical protein
LDLGRIKLARLVALSLVVAAGLAGAETTRTVEERYVPTGDAPSVMVCEGNEILEKRGNAGSVCVDVEDGESAVTLDLEDLGAETRGLGQGPGAPCAHYTVYADADHEEAIANGVFQGSSDEIPLPENAGSITVTVGESHDDGEAGLGATDCPDRQGTAGTLVATFS